MGDSPFDFLNTGEHFFVESQLGPVAHVLGGAAHNDAKVSCWDKNTHGHQSNLQWTLASAHNGNYYLCSAINPNFVLHQLGSHSNNGGEISLWDKNTHGHQGNLQVNFRDVGAGWYAISFVHSGCCVHLHGAQTANNTPITQWQYVSQANLHWRFVPVNPRPYENPHNLARSGKQVFIVSQLAPHAVAHVLGGAAHNDAKLSIWNRNTHGHQANLRWTVSQAPNGNYYINTAINPNFVIHQLGAHSNNAGEISLWDKNSHGHQGNLQVNFHDCGGGWYGIRFVHNGKFMHVYGATTHDNTAINQWDWVEQANLKWQFVKC
jgi:ribosomal protein S19